VHSYDQEKESCHRAAHQFLCQAVVHLLRITAGEIHSPASIDKHRITRDYPPIDEETLGSWRMAGRVQQLNLDSAHIDLVAALGFDHVGRRQPFERVGFRLCAPRLLVLHLLQQLVNAGNFDSRKVPADVIGWVWVTKACVTSTSSCAAILRIVSISHAASTTATLPHFGRTDQIDIILHRPDLDLLKVKHNEN